MKQFAFLSCTTIASCLLIFISSCSTKEKSPRTALFTTDSLNTQQTSYLTQRSFLGTDEKVLALYYPFTIEKNAVLLTDSKIVVYNNDTVQQEQLINIFDLSQSHGRDSTAKSTITVYRKDDTKFSYVFPGGLPIDNVFFTLLRDAWRSALSKQQPAETSADSSSGVMLGVGKPGEKITPLSTQK